RPSLTHFGLEAVYSRSLNPQSTTCLFSMAVTSCRTDTATEVKNEFGRLLEQAIQGTTVLITKHDSQRAVLISIDHFQTLQEAPQAKLNTLTEQFDTLL